MSTYRVTLLAADKMHTRVIFFKAFNSQAVYHRFTSVLEVQRVK